MKKTFRLIFAYGLYLSLVLLLVSGAFALRQNISQSPKPQSPKPQDSAAIPANTTADSTTGLSPRGPGPGGSRLPKGSKYIILTFDDGWASQYQAFKKMYPWKGTLYISSELIGKQDRLTLDNLKELYRNDWDICNHTANHKNLATLPLKEAAAEVAECSAWIAGQGFTRNQAYKHFAYPEGGYNPQVISILARQGILTARTTNAGNATQDYLQIGRTSLYGMTPHNIRDNIMSDQQLIILSFHRIVADSSTENREIDLKDSYFQEVLSAIRDSKRRVITITEWYQLQRAQSDT